MLRPTADQIAAAKGEAAQRFGRPELLLVELSVPIDFAILVAPLDLDAYCTKADEDTADLETGLRNQVHRQRVWPDAAAVSSLLDKRPAAAGKIVHRLMVRGGLFPGQPLVEQLADVAARGGADGEVIPGLSREKAAELLAGHPDQELWAVVGPGPLSVVMSTPEGEVWLAARTAQNRAVMGDKRVVRSKLDFVLQAVEWSAQPLEALLEDLPVLSQDLRKAYDMIGGEGASAISKSV